MSAGKALAVVEAGGDAICRPATKGSAYTCMDYLPAAKQPSRTPCWSISWRGISRAPRRRRSRASSR